MIFLRLLFVGGLIAAMPLRAVYAPIPAQEQPNDLTVSVRGGVTYDTNLFGAATGAINSVVWELAPRISYNASPTEKTFLALSYGLTLNYFDDRPGEKLLDSHDIMARLAHQFSKTTTIDITELLMISRNPESLLAGVPLNTDQSFNRNQIDGRFDTELNGKIGATVKARSIHYEYRNASLGRSLDRIENLFGGSLDYAILPEFKGVGEYRHQDVYYRKLGEEKNKRSDFVMVGFDYEAARKLTVTGRLGREWRDRAAERDTTSPYAEFSLKYDYAEASFVAAGYAYTLEETSDTARFTDTKVHRLFVNAQHRVTALITASASLGFEPSELQGRVGQGDINEDTTRLGFALSYLPTKNWTVSATYDYDDVKSEEAARDLRRERTGVNASYSF
jgi:hypothetical protein